MIKAVKGNWVEIETQVLSAEERAPQVPEDTKDTPLLMWARGYLVNETAALGSPVTIETVNERKIEGKLVEVNPRYDHDYGQTITELISTGIDLKKDLGGIE